MRVPLVKWLAWVLVVVFPASIVVADSTSAMLNGTGNVSVNGTPVDRATAVFPGDRVQTGANSLATLTSEGSSVMVPGNSILVFSPGQVSVLCGTAIVTTHRGMGVRVGKMMVQPARGTQARFQITQNEGQLQIIAREGTLAVDNGSNTTALQAGRMLTAPASCMAAMAAAEDQAGQGQDQGNQPTQDQDKKKKKKGGDAAGRSTPPTGGSTATSILPYAIGAGGLAGFLVWVTTRGTASSTTPTGQAQ